MKKNFIAIIILLAIMLVGCGSNQAVVETTTAPTEEININGYSSYDPFLEEDTKETTATEATEPVTSETKQTEPTQSAPSENDNAVSTEATEPPATEGESATPIESTEPSSAGSANDVATGLTAYEQYNAMSAAQQEEFVNSFASITDFITWYNAAKEEYEALHPNIDVGDGNIDLGEIVGGNG